MEDLDLSFMKLLEEKKEEQRKQKVTHIKTSQIKQEQYEKKIKQYLIGGALLTLGLVGGYGIHSIKDKVEDYKYAQAINAETSSIGNDARDIVNDNTDHKFIKAIGDVGYMYDHASIAKEIKEYESLYGELDTKVLMSYIMNNINEFNSNTKNIDTIISYATDAKNLEEYVHEEGYETKKDFIKGVREEYHDEQEKESIKEEYHESRGL